MPSRGELTTVARVVIALLAGALLLWAWRADVPWFERHMSPYRCLRFQSQLVAIPFVRAAASLGAVALLLDLRPGTAPRAARLARFVGVPSNAVGAARIAVAVALALGTAEVLWRALWPTPSEPCAYCPPVRPADGYTYGLVPSSEYRWHAGGVDFVYAVNAEGNRARTIHTEPDHRRPTILVAGESIALGMGLPYDAAFPALLEDSTGLQVVDTAVHSYGLDQSYLRSAEVLPTYEHPVALVTLFLADDVFREEAETRPHLVIGPGGGLKLAPPEPKWLLDLRLRGLWKDAISYHGDAAVKDVRAVVHATVDLARRHGAYPLFLTTNFLRPCLDVQGQEPWIFRTLFDDERIPRVHVEVLASEQIPGDPHAGAEAHRRFARGVEGALRAARVL